MSDYMEQWLQDMCGVHRTTVTRWRERGYPRPVQKLIEIAHRGDLGLIHPDWRGWRLDRDGVLVAPGGLTFAAGELLAIPLRAALIEELQHVLEVRSRKTQPVAALRARAAAIYKRLRAGS